MHSFVCANLQETLTDSIKNGAEKKTTKIKLLAVLCQKMVDFFPTRMFGRSGATLSESACIRIKEVFTLSKEERNFLSPDLRGNFSDLGKEKIPL